MSTDLTSSYGLTTFDPSFVDLHLPTIQRKAPAVESAPPRTVTTPPSVDLLAMATIRSLIQAEGNLSPLYQFTKRLLDVVGAAVLLVCFAPVMLVTFLILMVTTRGKPLFFQQRVGHCGRMFPMIKFRTMYVDAHLRQQAVKNEMDGPVFKNRRDPRITPIGRILRSTSIDELPQLFNILAGHMALVGPRPPIAKEVAQYEAWQRRRLSVKPGLTCLWQVSGRNEIGFTDWVRMDIWYVENQSLLTDLKLLWATPMSVLSRRGAY